MLRWMSNNTLNELNKKKKKILEVAPIEDKREKARLRWFDLVQRRPIDATIEKRQIKDYRHFKKKRKS